MNKVIERWYNDEKGVIKKVFGKYDVVIYKNEVYISKYDNNKSPPFIKEWWDGGYNTEYYYRNMGITI